MNLTEDLHTDVLIVGAGPVGLTLAMDLASRGISVVIAEIRHYAEPPSVKCNHVAARTMEQFRRLGVAHKLRDAGLPGYDSTGWFGIVAPAGTPAPIVARLNAEINAALADEQLKASMRNLGVEPEPQTPAAFDAYIRSETTKWAKVIATAHIKLD